MTELPATVRSRRNPFPCNALVRDEPTKEKSMSDPLYPEREPRRDPRYNTDDLRRMDDSASSASSSVMLWVIGGVAIVVVVGMLLFGMSDDTRTANKPIPETS